MLFHVSFIILEPTNVDQNWRQKHLTPFYSSIIRPRANMHRDKFVKFDKVYQMMQKIFSISEIALEKKCDIFSVVYILLSIYYSSKEQIFSALS